MAALRVTKLVVVGLLLGLFASLVIAIPAAPTAHAAGSAASTANAISDSDAARGIDYYFAPKAPQQTAAQQGFADPNNT